MSEQGQETVVQTATENTIQTAENASNTPASKLAAQFTKTGKIVIPAGANLDAFVDFGSTLNSDEIEDWTSKQPSDWQSNGSNIMVRTEEGDVRWLIVPNQETALSDPIVRAELYNMYLAKAANAARKEKASVAQFLTPGGFWQDFDNDAFNMQADEWIEMLKGKGAKNVNRKKLRLALSSHAHAAMSFPTAPKAFWERMLAAMVQRAVNDGYNPSLIQHWIATRDAVTVETAELNFTDNEDLSKITHAAKAEAGPGEASGEAIQAA